VLAHELLTWRTGRLDHDRCQLLRNAGRACSRASGCTAGLFGAGGRNRDNNGGVPVWLIVLLVSVVTYFLSQILILAISRYREFAADRGSALITGAPEHLMSALQKITSDTSGPTQDLRQSRHECLLHHPTVGEEWGATLFMTHPPLEKASRLGEMPKWPAGR